MKTLLKNGFVVDGTGKPGFDGFVVLEGDRILEVGTNTPEVFEGNVIDCKGSVIAAGFIDGHSHNDWFTDRRDPIAYLRFFAEQGITGSVAGNCGFSAAGYPKNWVERAQSGYKEDGLDFSTMSAWFDHIDTGSPENMASLQGHGTIRTGLVGFDPSPLSDENFDAMLRIAEESLEAGACGVSLGLMYAPGIFSEQREFIELAKLCKKYDRVMTVHPRAEGILSTEYPVVEGGRPHVLLGLDEVIDFGRQTGAKVQYCHSIYLGYKTFAVNDELLRTIDAAYDEGIGIGFDLYSMDCGSSFLTVILPEWYHKLSWDDKKKPDNLKRLQDDFEEMEDINGFGYKNFTLAGAAGYPEVEAFTGKKVHDVAQVWGISDFDAYVRLVEMSEGKARVTVDGLTNDEIIEVQARHPLSEFMNDTWYEPGCKQNEHLYSGFPHFLEMSRDGHGPGLEEAVYKMSGKIAERFSLNDRGVLKKGAFADITVFDYEGMKTYPGRKPDGINHVFINGKHVLKDGILDEKEFDCAGKALRSS